MQAPDPAVGGDPAAAPAAVVTPFPPPPPFFRLYAHGAAAGPPPPPPPSSDAPIVVFGAEHRASEDPVAPLQVPDLLRQAGVGGADTNADPRPALHLLLDAVLASALRLLDTLVDAPGDYAAGATAAIGALHNLMHAVNALRPGQTRHALARALEAQVGHKREAALAVREAARAAGEEVARRAAEVERAAAATAAEAGGAAGGGDDDDAMEVEDVGGAAAKKAVGRNGGIAAAATAAAAAPAMTG
jgi:mediator of RNA polymerase II transcription subunit 7